MAIDDSTTVAEDGSVVVAVLANDTGDGLDPGSVTVTSGPGTGTATVTGAGEIDYTAATDVAGTDSLTYQVTGASGDTATATVTITVTSVNDPPVVEPLALTVAEDTAVGMVVGTVVATDVDGDDLDFSGAGPGFTAEADGDVVVTDPLDARGVTRGDLHRHRRRRQRGHRQGNRDRAR